MNSPIVTAFKSARQRRNADGTQWTGRDALAFVAGVAETRNAALARRIKEHLNATRAAFVASLCK